ncbi:hypothetical protein J1N09_03175 [Aureitalea sp. L0-47]|uniref:hypothetical protein n=1 Tax=Aureitalea sp. L0-47 TaxID=2816962 RepID=UPI0022386B64|nr:hypothetical protein [Aureitalea sp. L0-47]MCW5518824.1 hypothetical protein [Aureitalea sp. L0-47]
MKKLSILLFVLLLSNYNATAQDIIELDGTQSMCIAGKGPGQDGAINPYLGSNSVAIVENVGKNEFSIRVQTKEELVKTIAIGPRETKEVSLLKGQVLYFDTDLEAIASVAFQKLED